MPLSLDIVTAERVVLSEDGFDIVLAPGVMGELGILPHHAPLITVLEVGELRARRGADEVAMAVSGGFLEVRNDRVTVLADSAERADEIDIARAEEAKRQAQEAMNTRRGDIDVAAVQAAARRADVRIRVAERRRARRTGPGGLPPTPQP